MVGVSPAQELPEPIGEEAFGVLKALYNYDAELPLEARVVELKDGETRVRRKIVFRSARAFLVPGLLEVPKEVEPPYPCVVLMHGWSGSKDSWWEDPGYTNGDLRKTLLEKGYAVFALDARGHAPGLRRLAHGFAALQLDLQRQQPRATHRARP